MKIDEIMNVINGVVGVTDSLYIDIQWALEKYEKEKLKDRQLYYCMSYVNDNVTYVEKFKTKEERKNRLIEFEHKISNIRKLKYFNEYVEI